MSEVIVIKVKKNGQTKFVKRASIFEEKPLVDSPFDAKHFNLADEYRGTEFGQPALYRELEGLNHPGVSCRARSGVDLDEAPQVVKVRLSYDEVGPVDF